MAISFRERVIVPDDVLVSELGGESVLLNLDRECYYGLDRTGTRIWTALTTSATIQTAFDRLLQEYDVAGAQLENDMRDLIDKLTAQGLVEITSE